ncbi:MAG: hypothetical protein CVU47_12430, partial [Chloroflexi bacterium HGW-Chloroflexi-9]
MAMEPIVLVESAGRERQRGLRSDALPEHTDYRDRGCEVSPTCLGCPLARCRYATPGGVRTARNSRRNSAIKVALMDEGLTVDELAARFKVSRRTIFRVVTNMSAMHRRERRRRAEDPLTAGREA